MPDQKTKEQERREYYRIYDAIALQVEPILKSNLSKTIAEFERYRHQFMAQSYTAPDISKITRDLESLQKDHPGVVDYLMGLEARISSLTETMEDKQNQPESIPTHKVNICGNGISFGSDHPMMVGEYFILKMQFFPSRVRLLVIAESVNCREVDGKSIPGAFFTGAQFMHINENDREVLLKHIHELQIKSLQVRSGFTSVA